MKADRSRPKTTLLMGDGSNAVTLEWTSDGLVLGIEHRQDGDGCWTALTRAEAIHLLEALEDEL